MRSLAGNILLRMQATDLARRIATGRCMVPVSVQDRECVVSPMSGPLDDRQPALLAGLTQVLMSLVAAHSMSRTPAFVRPASMRSSCLARRSTMRIDGITSSWK